MKHLFKTVAAVLFLGLSFASCNDNFEEGSGAIAYPNEVPLSKFARDYTPAGGIDYTVNFTLDEKGDTVCDVTTYNTKTKQANVFSNGTFEYDKRTGMITVDYAESMYEMPARIVIAYKNDLKGMIVNLYEIKDGTTQKKDNFTATAVDTFSVMGDWHLNDGTMFSLNADGTATINGEESSVKGTYEFAYPNGTVTFENGQKYALSVNANGQMFVSVDGAEPVYATHIMTQPKNDWYEYAVGAYSNWLFGSDASGNITPYDAVLEYSPSRMMARIADFALPGSELSFYWNIGEEEVTPAESMFATGYTHVQDGKTFGEVFAIPQVLDEAGHTAIYDPATKTFTFGHLYYIPGVGGFGADVDTYTITGVLVDE